MAKPQLSICCFRYVPSELKEKLRQPEEYEAELDQLNTKIMYQIQRGGRAYLSSATLNGKFALRACITNFRTTRADIDETLEIVREAGAQVFGSAIQSSEVTLTASEESRLRRRTVR